jgi:hypothetical protein
MSAELEGHTDMTTNGRRGVAALAISLLTTLAFAGSANAASYYPSTFDDDFPTTPADCVPEQSDPGPGVECSLREAVEAANDTADDDDVILQSGTYRLDWDRGALVVRAAGDGEQGSGALTVDGMGARETIIEVGLLGETPPRRGFTFQAGSVGELIDLAITRGQGDGADESSADFFDGGAIAVQDDDDGGNDAEVLLERVRLFDNSARSGGAIKNRGTLIIVESLIDHNQAAWSGGGIENDDQLVLENTTITDNVAMGLGQPGLSEEAFDGEGNGGGVDSDGNHAEGCTCLPGGEGLKSLLADEDEGADEVDLPGGALTLVANSTIANNAAAGAGGGFSTAIPETTTQFDEDAEPVSLFFNSVVSDNTAEEDPNCSGNGGPEDGPFESSFGNNIENGTSCQFTAAGDKNADPKLGELEDNGGDTDTRELLASSPAIDAADDEVCPAIDQRGVDRPQGDHCDMGAYEFPQEPREPQEPQEPTNPRNPIEPIPPGIAPRDPSCRDRVPPLTRLTRRGLKIGRKGVRLKGTSRDRRRPCVSGVQRVEVSLAKVSGTDLNCRFLRLSNRFLLSPFMNCRQSIRFIAKGQNHWRFTYRVKLRPGKYRATARAWDNVDNKETPKKRRNIIYFTVK